MTTTFDCRASIYVPSWARKTSAINAASMWYPPRASGPGAASPSTPATDRHTTPRPSTLFAEPPRTRSPPPSSPRVVKASSEVLCSSPASSSLPVPTAAGARGERFVGASRSNPRPYREGRGRCYAGGSRPARKRNETATKAGCAPPQRIAMHDDDNQGRRQGLSSSSSTSSRSWRRDPALTSPTSSVPCGTPPRTPLPSGPQACPRDASCGSGPTSSVGSHSAMRQRGTDGGGSGGRGRLRRDLPPPPPPPDCPPPLWPPWRGAFTMPDPEAIAVEAAASEPSVVPLRTPGVCPPPTSSICTWLRGSAACPARCVPFTGHMAFAPPYAPDECSLTRELLDFACYVTLSPAEEDARRDMLETLTSIVRTTRWAPAATGQVDEKLTTEALLPPRVVVYGSAALGLSIHTSDMDLTLVFPCGTTQTASPLARTAEENGKAAREAAAMAVRQREQARLRALSAAIVDHFGSAMRVQILEDCRVPVLKLYDVETRIAVDIHVCEEAGTASPAVTEEVTDGQVLATHQDGAAGEEKTIAPGHATTRTERVLRQQQAWLAQHPVAAPLIVITKAALHQWNLHRLFAGGLSSTAVYSLVHRFLAEHSLTATPDDGEPATREEPLAESLGDHWPAPTRSCGSPAPPLTMTNLLSREALASAPLPGAELTSPLIEKTVSATATATMSITQSNSSSQLAWSSAASTCTTISHQHHHDDGEAEVDATGMRLLPAHGGVPPTAPAPSTEHACLPYAWMDWYCQTHYGVASFARLFLSLWMYLSNEIFAMGYGIPDIFAALVRAEEARDQSEAAPPLAVQPSPCPASTSTSSSASLSPSPESRLPSPSAGRAHTQDHLYVGADLSAPSYKLPDILALFRHSAMTLEAFMNAPVSPTAAQSPVFDCLPSPLSTVFVDPRYDPSITPIH